VHQIKSARPYVKKAVYAVYNVSNEETVESISEFVEELCGSKPISCFKLNSPQSTDSTLSDTNNEKSLSFRICIDHQFASRFLDGQNWYNGITIKPWKFKPKVPAQANKVIDLVTEDVSVN
jgi:hypothetical protein